jgi:excisionase family DNA binding protein
MKSLLSVKQVAFILKVHPLTIRRYITQKRLKAVKVGGNVRIEENEINNFHKEIKPENKSNKKTFKSATTDKKFTKEDPLFRLLGRGASLKLSK